MKIADSLSAQLLLVVIFIAVCCEGQCPRRNEDEASAVGRQCQTECDPSQNQGQICGFGRTCICDNECGYSCVATDVTCPPPPVIRNMARVRVYRRNFNNSLALVSSLPYQYNDMAEYECTPGFRKTRPIMNHFCHSGRGWTGETTCVEACRSHNDFLAGRENQECTTSCSSNNDCSSNNEQCMCDGYCGKSCVDPGNNCGPAEPSANSAIVYSEGNFGRIARYTCNEGYYPSGGDSTRMCTGSGKWNRRLITCERLRCGDPYSSVRESHGRILSGQSSSRAYYIGSTIEIACRPNHVLVGSSSRTCLSNGQWNGSHSACDSIDDDIRCKHPGVPVNGRLNGRNFSIGAVVEFECISGYVMLGDAMQECLYFLQWSGGGAPKCVNPLHPLDIGELFAKLQQGNDEVQEVVQELSPGHSASSETNTFTNLYLVIDLADDVGDDILEHSIAFAEDRVVTVSRGDIISCTIIAFASSVRVLLPLKTFSVSIVIENLRNILVERDEIVQDVGWGRNTEAVLENLNAILASSISEEPDRENLVFLLINGKANEGRSPTIIANQIREQYDESIPKVYVVSYGGGSGFGLAFEELQSLAIPQSLFLPNPNLDQLIRYSDNFETPEECGRAGDIKGLHQQAAHIGNVAGGKLANAGAWPWHAIVCRRTIRVLQTLRYNLKGGASLLNSKWVVTAAHLFGGVTKASGWDRGYMIVFGINRIPQNLYEALPKYAQAFDSERIIIHNNFSDATYDYDIALIELGRPYRQYGFEWLQISEVVPLSYSPYVRPICLPCSSSCVRQHLTDEHILSGNEDEDQKCRIEKRWLLERNQQANSLTVVTGFGSPDALDVYDFAQISTHLKQGPIKLQSETDCLRAVNVIRPEGLPPGVQYTSRMMCGIGGQSGSTDACKGDSGGAFVREISSQANDESCWVQIGLVSWGWGCAQTDRRGNPIPGFYTNFVTLMDWVIPKISSGFTNTAKECRRDVLLLEVGRSCRKSCMFDSDCRGEQKRCACDDVCGMSCFNPMAECDEVPTMEHGTIIQEGNTYGMIITYSCNEGYELVGEPIRVCRSDRKWSGGAPTCQLEEVSCATPSSLKHGSVIAEDGDYHVGNALTYRCDEGYKIEGLDVNEISVTCLTNGQWSASPPVCRAHPLTFCDVPEELKSVKTEVASGGNITYVCRRKFNFIDYSTETLTAICQDNGLWTQDMPICQGFGCTSDRITCSFPFIYRGHYEYECSTRDANRPWCSNTPAVKSHYGDCSSCHVRPNFQIYDPADPNPYNDQCNKTLRASETPTTVTLPNHPSSYAHNLDCFWIIRSSSSESQVELIITSFISERCCDYLKIGDGSTALAGKSTLIRGRFLNQYRIISTFGVLYVLFHSDESISYDSGLEMIYRERTYENCGGELDATATPQTISSPGWPHNYTNNVYCKWIISAPPGYQVKLDIPQVDTEPCCDEFSIRDGPNENSENFVTIKGSEQISQSIYSSNGKLMVLFNSNQEINGQGFSGTYVATIPLQRPLTPEVTVCNDKQLEIPSSGYGNFSLRPVLSTGQDPFHCQWLISAPTGKQVQIWFGFYALQNIILLVRDGSHANAKKIGSVEGKVKDFTSFVSTNGALRIEAIAFPELIHDTFYGYYEEYQPGRDSEGTTCESSQHFASSSLRYIATPNWPGYYPENLTCSWTITARENHYVRLHFLGLLTEKNFDYLKIYDITTSNLLLDVSGLFNQRFTAFSVGRSLRVEFTSNTGGTRYGGFRAAYEESSVYPQYLIFLDRWNY